MRTWTREQNRFQSESRTLLRQEKEQMYVKVNRKQNIYLYMFTLHTCAYIHALRREWGQTTFSRLSHVRMLYVEKLKIYAITIFIIIYTCMGVHIKRKKDTRLLIKMLIF